jgi:hypothetical protein
LKLPSDQRRGYRDTLNEVERRLAWSWFAGYLSQHELGYDWRTLAARVQQSATELTGAKTEAKWEEPPR